jgi:hypothetical protein
LAVTQYYCDCQPPCKQAISSDLYATCSHDWYVPTSRVTKRALPLACPSDPGCRRMCRHSSPSLRQSKPRRHKVSQACRTPAQPAGLPHNNLPRMTRRIAILLQRAAPLISILFSSVYVFVNTIHILTNGKPKSLFFIAA